MTANIDILETLKQVDLLANLDDELLLAVADTSSPRAFSPGDQLITQGTEADGAWVILEGEVELRRNGKRVNQLGQGQICGDLSLLSGEPHAVDVIALTEGSRVALGMGEFRAAVRHHPEVAFEFIKVLVDRIYHIQELLDPFLRQD